MSFIYLFVSIFWLFFVFFFLFFTHCGGGHAVQRSQQQRPNAETHEGDVRQRRRRCCSSGSDTASSVDEWWEGGVGGRCGEACARVHVGGHATVANAAVIPRGFVGRQSVTDFSVVRALLGGLHRHTRTHAHGRCGSTVSRYRHNGARQLRKGRSLFCTGRRGGVVTSARSLESHRHTQTCFGNTHAHPRTLGLASGMEEDAEESGIDGGSTTAGRRRQQQEKHTREKHVVFPRQQTNKDYCHHHDMMCRVSASAAMMPAPGSWWCRSPW